MKKPSNGYENIFIQDNRNVFIGSKNGLIHYDPYFNKDYHRQESVIFREISFGGNDSEITIYNILPGLGHSHFIKGKIPFQKNSVSFRFANPSFEAGGASKFSYRLHGFDQQWSGWEPNTFKEYTNLSEGDYRFDLKVQNLNAPSDEIYSFSFSISPPFYRSITAYFVYILLMIIIVSGNILFIQKRIARTQRETAKRHERELYEQELLFREQSLESDKEIIQLKNEGLKKEITHKTKELANTTLHIIHKNKILNAIKSQLKGIIDFTLPESKREQMELLISKINRELRNERSEKLFDTYFEEVHQDFISRLRSHHPELTPREIRLCAYLRMNLTTKEIAPLMNISVRGIEIGRYRLRKKLQLDREAKLMEYLLTL